MQAELSWSMRMAHLELEQEVKATLLEVLDEAFEHGHGIFLDEGTTFLETLEQIDAATASRRAGPKCATIAAHVAHATFYLDVAARYTTVTPPGKVDWMEIWRTVSEVSPQRWNELKAGLRRAYGDLLERLKSEEAWSSADTWSEVMGIVAHTAYHLGAVRQAYRAVK